MIINQANLAVLRTTFQKRFGEAFEGVEAWSDKVATRIPSSNANSTYGWMNQAVRLREWVGARQAMVMREHNYVLSNVPFEATFEVPREHILDDSLGIYTEALIPQFAEATRKHPDLSIIERVFNAAGGNGPTGFDGLSFWHASHPTYNGAGVYSNDLTVEASSYEVLGEQMAAARSDMMTIVGENGIIIRNDPRLLIVPSAQEYRFLKLTESTTLPADNGSNMDNILKGMFKVLVVPELDAISSTTIYMADVSRPIKPILWQVRSNPIFRAFDTGKEEHAFNDNVFRYGIDGDDGGPYRANAGVTLPFLMARITLTDLPT